MTSFRKRNRHLSGAGFTLLEIILSLSLAVVLISLIGSMVRVYLRAADASRMEVREAILARNVLGLMAADLHNAVRYAPQDTSDVEALAGLGSADELLDESEETDEDEELNSSVSQGGDYPSQPGLFGTQTMLQVDISQIPRLDQYYPLVTARTGGTLPSDIKSVAYYVRQSALGHSPRSTEMASSGLMRRSMDRAVARWAADSGNIDLFEQSEEPLAPEIVGIEFHYFNGTEWSNEWDSDERGGLPVAVELVIALLRPAEASNGDQLPGMGSLENLDPEKFAVYRLLVHLPMAEETESGEVVNDLEEETSEGDDEP